jgi:hypothetical protein
LAQSFVVSTVVVVDFPLETRAPSTVPVQLCNCDLSVTVSVVAVPLVFNAGLKESFAVTWQCSVPVPLTGDGGLAPAGTAIVSNTAADTAHITDRRRLPLI